MVHHHLIRRKCHCNDCWKMTRKDFISVLWYSRVLIKLVFDERISLSTKLLCTHYSDIIMSVMASEKSPAPGLFAQPFVHAHVKEKINAPRHWPLWGGNRWIPLTMANWHRKGFHLMTPSCLSDKRPAFYIFFKNWLKLAFCQTDSRYEWRVHYSDIIMSAMASQITGVSIVCSAVCLGGDQRKHQGSASLAFVGGIHRWPMDSPHKGPVTRKVFPFDDVIMRVGPECHTHNGLSHWILNWHDLISISMTSCSKKPFTEQYYTLSHYWNCTWLPVDDFVKKQHIRTCRICNLLLLKIHITCFWVWSWPWRSHDNAMTCSLKIVTYGVGFKLILSSDIYVYVLNAQWIRAMLRDTRCFTITTGGSRKWSSAVI